jgi:hypothetical protein
MYPVRGSEMTRSHRHDIQRIKDASSSDRVSYFHDTNAIYDILTHHDVSSEKQVVLEGVDAIDPTDDLHCRAAHGHDIHMPAG